MLRLHDSVQGERGLRALVGCGIPKVEIPMSSVWNMVAPKLFESVYFHAVDARTGVEKILNHYMQQLFSMCEVLPHNSAY